MQLIGGLEQLSHQVGCSFHIIILSISAEEQKHGQNGQNLFQLSNAAALSSTVQQRTCMDE